MKALVTAPYNKEGLKKLEEYIDSVHYHSWKTNDRAFTPSELIELLGKEEYDVFITEHDQVDKSVIDSCPSLKLIGVCRGTPSNVDVGYAESKNIKVVNTPGRNAQAVAEMFIGNLITFYRKTIQAHQWLKNKNWEEGAHTSYLEFKGNELAGKTVGMVGFGAVGQHIAKLLKAFPAQVVFYDPYYKNANGQFKSVSLEEVFEQSDIVTINLPANESTRGMIDKGLIDKMSKESVFVNMSRAMVVHTEDLNSAIQDNRIRGAILDVFDHEPPGTIDYMLIDHPNVLATPHIAGATHEVEDHHVEIMNKQIVNWIKENYERISDH